MKKKVKKYVTGDFVEDDYASSDDAKNLMLAADREAVEYEGEKIAKPLREAAQAAKAEPLRMASFGEAFKEARGRGDKTFEYMGKQYTTEMAKPKSESKAPAGPRVSDTGDESERLSRRKPSPISKTKTVSSKARLGMADLSGYKKGGMVSASKRADGIAQRGKTRGKIC